MFARFGRLRMTQAVVACACAASLLLVPGLTRVAAADAPPADAQAVDARASLLLDTVHLDMRDGDDAHDGASGSAAVRSFDRARDLLAPGGTIVLESPIVIDGKATLSLEGKGNARVVRGPAQEGPMVLIEGGATLNLEHITIDGQLEGKNLDSIIKSDGEGSSLTLGSGAVLQNNSAAGGTFGSAIAGWDGLNLVLNDGAVIRGNSTRSAGYGAVMLANGSTFTMNGGRITGNRSNRGGGVALMASSMVMKGGSIDGNSAYDVLGGRVGDGYGAGVYLSSYENMSGLPGDSNSIVAGEVSFTMEGGSISGNTAESQGGGILAYPMADVGDIKVEINAGSIDGNAAQKGNGGGIALYDLFDGPMVDLTLSGGSVSGNSSAELGGGVFLFGVAGEQARFTGGRIEGNAAVKGGGVAAFGGSVWNMSGGVIEGNEASAGGGVVLYPVGAESALKMTSGSIVGNNAKADQAKTKGDGVFQGGLFEISGDAAVGEDNDVYLPSGRIVDVTAPFAGASTAHPMSITSEDHVVEPVGAATAGTKLVRYHEQAGGAELAMDAQRAQLFVPSAKMLRIDPTFYIGKSMFAEQLEYMTYIERPAAHVVSYRYAGEVPQGADALLPGASEHVEGEYVTVAAAPALDGYRFLGWKPVDVGLGVSEGRFVMPGEDVVLEGMWEKLPTLTPDPDSEDGGSSGSDQGTDESQDPPATDDGPTTGDDLGKDEGPDKPGLPDEGGRPASKGDRDTLPLTGDASMALAAAPFAAGALALCASRRMRRESHE